MTTNITIDDLDFYIFAHNRAILLSETIKSVLNQTIRPKHITILDNESTEDVESVAKYFEENGVRYVKTFGRHGNYLKSKEMASKKYVVRFHDDNLIHPEFIEKMLVALNSTDNISAVTSTFTTFESAKAEVYPDEYKNPKHLLNYFVIMNNPKDFVYHRIRSNVYPRSVWICGTPFMAIRTDIYKNFDEIDTFKKYSKANDIGYFIHYCEKGRLVCMTDPSCAFFRMHAANDTVSDENSLTLEQIKTLTSVMVNTFKDDRDEAMWRDFFEFIYQLYPDATKNVVVASLPTSKFIEQLFADNILPGFTRPIYEKYPDISSCVASKKPQKKKISLRNKIFSVSCEFDKPAPRLILYILGIRVSLKIKKF